MKNFFKSCLALTEDKYALAELSTLVAEPQPSVRLKRNVNHIGKRLKTGCELQMNVQIDDYDMDFIILDLGSDVNILTIQTWESMGNPRLVRSPIQLCLAN